MGRRVDDVSIELQLTPHAPSQARRWIQEAIPLPSLLQDSVTLLVSEIVTNSVRYSGRAPQEALTISAWRTEDAIHVEVEDPGPGEFANPEEGSHFGLGLVNSLADDWGIRLQPTTVWFEMRPGA